MSKTNAFDYARRGRSTRTGNIAVDGDRHDAGIPLQVASASGRDETPLERVDRNMQELNGELRVVVTGVQVLFAFLLVVPFDTATAQTTPARARSSCPSTVARWLLICSRSLRIGIAACGSPCNRSALPRSYNA
jgi:hypothetical protein